MPQKRAPFGALAEAVTPDNHYFAPGAMQWKSLILKGVATEKNQWGNKLKTRENR